MSRVNVALPPYAHLPEGPMFERDVSHSTFAELVNGIGAIIPSGRSVFLSFYCTATETLAKIDEHTYYGGDFSKLMGYFVAGFNGRVISSLVISYVFYANSKSGTLSQTGTVTHGNFDELNDGVLGLLTETGTSMHMTQVDSILIDGEPSTHIRCDYNELAQLVPVERVPGASDVFNSIDSNPIITKPAWIDSGGMYRGINGLLPVVCLIWKRNSNQEGSLFSILCDLNLRLSTLIST